LQQRIESVLVQSYQDFELIILDDESTDDSTTVIESYRNHPRVSKIILNEVNSGSTFKQWEKGINAAKGDLIWIAESDDWCEPTLLEELITSFHKDPNCTFSYCQSHCILDANVISWTSHHPFLNEGMDGTEFIKKYMLRNNAVYNASMVLWKKEIYNKISRNFLNYRFCGDWLFWVELAKLGNVHICGKTLNYFRKHDKDLSTHAYGTGLYLLELMSVLNAISNQNLIDSKAYNFGFKHHYRTYWIEYKNIDSNLLSQIQALYRNPLSGKTCYYKNLVKAIFRISIIGFFKRASAE